MAGYTTNAPKYNGLATTAGYKDFNRSGTSPLMPQTQGIGATEAIWDEHMGSFIVDIYDDVRKIMPEEFPLLRLLEDVGTESINDQLYSYAEGKEGDDSIWIKWNNMRLRQTESSPVFNSSYVQVSPDNSAYYGGRMPLRGCRVNVTDLTAGSSTNISYLINRTSAGGAKDAAVQADVAAGGTATNTVDYNATTGDSDNLVAATSLQYSDHETSGQNAVFSSHGQYLALLINGSNDLSIGKKEDILIKYINTLQVNKYTLTDSTGTIELNQSTISGGTRSLTYSANARAVQQPFANLCYKVVTDPTGTPSTTYHQMNNAICRIHSFIYDKAMTMGILIVDLSVSNLAGYTSIADQKVVVLLDEVAHPSTITSFPNGGWTRMSEHILINRFANKPKLIPEGANFSRGGGYIYQSDGRWNNVQIFASDKYGVTGSRMANGKFKFYDDMKMTRERELRKYNRERQNAYIWGQKTNGFYTAGSVTDYEDNMPVRGTGGFFDMSLHNIPFFKMPIPTTPGSNMAGLEFQNWMEGVLMATKKSAKQGAESRTYMCGKDLIKILAYWEKYLTSTTSTNGSALGANHFNYVKDSTMTLGIGVYRYETIEGSLSFVYDPTMDYITEFPLPYWWTYGLRINPRFLCIAIDKTQIKEKIYRADKLHTGIQPLGQDMYEEAMRGESGIEIKNCSNHAFFDFTPA